MRIIIVGCQGTVNIEVFLDALKEFSLLHRIAVQALHAPFIYGKDHVITAVEHAIRAFNNQTQTCHTLDMEILLYASGRRQIREAIEILGIQPGQPVVVVAVTDSNLLCCNGFIEVDTLIKFLVDKGLCIDQMVIEGDKQALTHFGVTPAELKTVDNSMYDELILERVALVDIIT